ncbi:MAG TPA: hypothetical protein VJV75_13330 [Candidatus Polarisedimenticolia bacterium]|nr:hypothetical protein [Candidatus Polarisedimenticolia bacterium]
MPIQMKNDGSGIDQGQNAPSGSAGHTVVAGDADQNLSAAVLALLDEINTLRTHGAIGLAAKTPAQIAAAIAAKKT